MMADWADRACAHFQRFGHEPAAGHGLGHEIEQFAHVKRLEEVVVGAELGGFDGGFGRAESGHHDDGQLRLGGMELLDQFEAGQARHLQIGEHHVARVLPGAGQALIAARGRGDLIAFGLQLLFQRRRNAGVVFNQQNFRLRVHHLLLASCGAAGWRRWCRDSPRSGTPARRRVFRQCAPRWPGPGRCLPPWW